MSTNASHELATVCKRTTGVYSQLTDEQYVSRRGAVHKILYLLFTEGYLSSHATNAIRRELCQEAIRLTTLLAQHPIGQVPETYALLALMHLHEARVSGRQDDAGGLLLLEEQDRSRWDQKGIQAGMAWLAKSADGDRFSHYHAEAGIAAEHTLAPSFEETRRDRVVDCYAVLEQAANSPIHTLNRAVAVAENESPAAALAVLADVDPPPALTNSYCWAAVLADLHRRNGDRAKSDRYRDQALQLAPSRAVKALLERRLCTNSPEAIARVVFSQNLG